MLPGLQLTASVEPQRSKGPAVNSQTPTRSGWASPSMSAVKLDPSADASGMQAPSPHMSSQPPGSQG